MAGKRTARTVVSFVELVDRVESEASMLIQAGSEGKERLSKTVPYTYFQLSDKVDTLAKARNALADIVDNGRYPVMSLIQDINYGLEHRTRADYGRGVDPSLTPVQRQAIDNIRPLVENGVLDFDVAVAALTKTGLTPEQIATYLAADQS